jgi:hypothetical protein
MYESPKDFIDEWIPQGRISFDLLGRLAGALYLLSLVVPFLSDRLAYGVYQGPAGGDPVLLNLPFGTQIITLAIEGTLAGPAKTAATADNAARGVALGLIDAVFFPLLIFALPITGAVLTLIPVILGVLLLTGYDKHLVALSWGYVIPMTAYSIMLGMKSVGFAAHVGAAMCSIAALILLALFVDRTTEAGLVSDNGYEITD